MAMATVAEAMWGTLLRFSVVLAAWLALAPAAHAGGPGLVIGATEDAVRSTTLVDAKAQMDLLALAGFRAVRITQIWAPGERAVSPDDVTTLENVVAAAKLSDVTVLDERHELREPHDTAHRRPTSPTSPPTQRTSSSRSPSYAV